MQFKSEEDSFARIGLLVADTVTAMLAYWDKDLICRFANAAYLDWFGKTRADMVDKMTISELLGPDLFEKNKEYIFGALRGVRQTFERNIPVPSGGFRPSLANYFPHIVDGVVHGFVVHVADISYVKELESELVRSNKIIGDQNKRLLNFANIVSHNLGSYANNLQILLELLVTANTDLEKSKVMHHLTATAEAFSSTVSNLNEIVAAQNQLGIKSVPVSLHEYVEKVCRILRVQIEAAHARIRNEVDPKLVIEANPAYIESIILNLLSNAIKYRDSVRPVEVVLSSKTTEREVFVVVADNGLGIDLKKYGNDIFGIHKTFHGNKDAKGIGLFITRFQVESMGGSIGVTSDEGKGATFTVQLPLHVHQK